MKFFASFFGLVFANVNIENVIEREHKVTIKLLGNIEGLEKTANKANPEAFRKRVKKIFQILREIFERTFFPTKFFDSNC